MRLIKKSCHVVACYVLGQGTLKSSWIQNEKCKIFKKSQKEYLIHEFYVQNPNPTWLVCLHIYMYFLTIFNSLHMYVYIY